MKKHVMKKWVEALRSGEYKQGIGWLVDNDDNFCCLGVLCNIAPASIRDEWVFTDGDWRMDGEGSGLSPKFRKWSGVTCDEEDRLVILNDRERESFETIADYIEEHLV